MFEVSIEKERTMTNDPTKWKLNPKDLLMPYVDIKCQRCGVKLDPEREDFVSFYGNVMVGLAGGIIGNNIHFNEIKRVTFICRSEVCGEDIIKLFTDPDY